MAMSDYDSLSLNEKSEPINGVFVSPLGVKVEIYKTYLFIQDEKAWEEGGSFIRPTVMQILSGNITYKDVKVHAIRGPQQGVFAIVESSIYAPLLKEACPKCEAQPRQLHQKECPDYQETQNFVMVGCGVVGYENSTYIGVSQESLQFLENWIKGNEIWYGEGDRDEYNLTDEEIIEYYKSEAKVVRIENGKVRVYYDSYRFEDHIRNIDLSKALRFNQGDGFFAESGIGTNPQVTAPGEAKPTIFSQLLDSIFEDLKPA